MRLQIAEKLKSGAFDDIRTVAGMKRSSYYALLLNAYEKLQTERLYVSDYHVSDHIERVMFAEDYGVADEQMDLCRRVCRALKDADNLDRVRIHDLDTNYRRFPKSKSLEKTAEAIYCLGGRREW